MKRILLLAVVLIGFAFAIYAQAQIPIWQSPPLAIGTAGSALALHTSGSATLTPGAVGITSTVATTMTVANSPTVGPTGKVPVVNCTPTSNIVAAGGGFTIEAWVSSANTVTVLFGNPSAGAQTPNAVVWACDVWYYY